MSQLRLSNAVSVDLGWLEKTLQICAVFITLPFCFRRTTWKILCYYLIHLIVHTFSNLRQCFMIYQYFKNPKLYTIEKFLILLDMFPSSCFLVNIIYILFTKKNALEKVFERLKFIDESLFVNIPPERTNVHLMIWYYHSIPVISLINRFIANKFEPNRHIDSTLSMIYILVIIYMKFLLMLTIKVTEKIVQVRYCVLENEIKNYFCVLRIRIGNRKLKNLPNLQKVFFEIQQTIEEIDGIFRWPILLLVMKACSGLLRSFGYTLLVQTSVTIDSYWNMAQLSVESVVSFS